MCLFHREKEYFEVSVITPYRRRKKKRNFGRKRKIGRKKAYQYERKALEQHQ